MQKTIIYLRVSDPSKADQLLVQETKIRDMLHRHGHDPSDAIVIRDIAAGTDVNRPGWSQVVQMLDSGQVSILAVDDVSRISREESVLDKLLGYVRRGLRVMTYTHGNEPNLLFSILSMFSTVSAQVYRNRVRRGMQKAARKGRAIGRPPYGYAAANGALVVDQKEADVVRGIFRAFTDECWSIKEISKMLTKTGTQRRGKHTWYPSTIVSILSNPIYQGRRVWGGDRAPPDQLRHIVPVKAIEGLNAEIPNLRIVSEEMWLRAQQRLNKQVSLGPPRDGDIVCGERLGGLLKHFYRKAA